VIDDNIGFQTDPRNGYGIKRSRTTDRLRVWEFPRTLEALEAFNTELGKLSYPGVYVLFEGERKVYVGEAKDLYKRIKTHLTMPVDRIERWDRVLLINDGRPAAQSDFNDTTIRKAIEFYLKGLFKANRYQVVSQADEQTRTSIQNVVTDAIIKEINIVLIKQNIIEKLMDAPGEREIQVDELRLLLQSKGFNIQQMNAKEAILNGQKYYIRPGSKKTKGWQITLRGRKPGSLIDSFVRGEGYLLVNRDGILIIPLSELQRIINDAGVFDRDTIDIFIDFSNGEVKAKYHESSMDVSAFRLIP